MGNIDCLKWDATAGIRCGIAEHIVAVETVCLGWTPRMYDTDMPLRYIETKTSIHRKPAITGDDFVVEFAIARSSTTFFCNYACYRTTFAIFFNDLYG